MTAEQFQAIQEMLARTVDEQRQYHAYGNPQVDHGDKWPEVARAEAQRYRIVTAWLKSENGEYGLITDLESLAGILEAQ